MNEPALSGLRTPRNVECVTIARYGIGHFFKGFIAKSSRDGYLRRRSRAADHNGFPQVGYRTSYTSINATPREAFFEVIWAV